MRERAWHPSVSVTSSSPFAKETVNEIILWRMGLRTKDVGYYAETPDGGYRPVDYAESRRATLGLAAALRARGLQRGDRVALQADVRHEWATCDFANILAGLVTVGIYPTCTADQVRYILDHSESRWLVIEADKYLAPLTDVINGCERLDLVVSMEDDAVAPEGLRPPMVALSELIDQGAALLADGGEEEVLDEARAAEPDDLMMIVYTSGTTGPPKGAVLSQRNIFSVCEAVMNHIPFDDDERGLVYLPLAHSLQRTTLYIGLRMGGTGYYLSDIPRIGEVLPIVQPTRFVAVPRILEKIHGRAVARIEELSGFPRMVADWAFGVGRQVSALQQRKQQPGLLLELQRKVADRLVFSKIRAKLGGRVRLIISGGAPLAVHISEWFHAAGMLVIEGYGLTETSAPATSNTPDDFKFGTVGKPLPGTEVMVADDGEVLIRGPGVFLGYYKDEAGTAAAFNEDGWFRSGDIGELDDDGFLKITDRKKELIITAGGKNISPANIENLLKEHPLIGQALVHGDNKPYLVTLIALEPDDAAEWAEAAGLPERDVAALAKHPAVLEAIDRHVADVNARLARYETLKKHRVIEVPFGPDNGYLTPTLKLKRRAILKDFGDVVEDLYTAPRA